MLDRRSHVPLHVQLADLLRKRISSGDLAPGDRLPSESDLSQTYDVSRPTIRKTLAALRFEGLIESELGTGHFVRDRGEPKMVRLRRGDEASVSLAGGMPQVVVSRKDGTTETFPADQVVIRPA
ncbi:GntR family transcriptional regulator [Actinopolymorpha sp. B9G3]|uniref:GntR family transcriptional regulator n=1 Tax=Actinopolymorpha sp. B9G3 TaxID=3158970 RepID=UPI0032D9A5B4